MTNKYVTRRRLLRAFSIPGYSHSDAIAVVNAYMRNNPEPPVWSAASVKGMFGVRIYRAWRRYIKPLQQCRSSHMYVIQTLYDFDGCISKLTKQPKDIQTKHLVIDEFWRVCRP